MAFMYDSIVIGTTDVTAYRLTWTWEGDFDESIDILTISFAPSLAADLSLSTGQSITVQRGLSGSKDEYVFRGQITQVNPNSQGVDLVCKNPLIDAIKEGQTTSWDKDIDTEAGVGSEIFKDICDHAEISYSATSITSTGTAESNKIVKLVQNDEDDYQIMNEIAEVYDYSITYDYENDIVNFHPRGLTTYGKTLVVGTDITKQIKWTENMEQLNNKVKIIGTTVYDKIVETFAASATSFTLQKTPEDTEVRQTNDAGTLYTRGQRGLGTVGTDFDYYVDELQKKIIFASAKSNIWARYGAQIPMPVVIKNQTSIDAYGGPNKKPHFKKFVFNDIKDVTDAENRGTAILQKYSTPFNEASSIPVHDDVITSYGNIWPGYNVTIQDNYNPGYENITVTVRSVKKSFPHKYDKITVGDKIWRTEDWQANQSKLIQRLLNALNKNQDYIIQRFDSTRTLNFGRRHMLLNVKDRSSDGVNTFILGHPTFGILGTQKLGDVGTAYVTQKITQGNNIYREFCYDTTFQNSGSTTGLWDTTNKLINLSSGSVAYTSEIALGTTYTYYTVDIANSSTSGSAVLLTEISGDGGVNYETVTLDTRTAFTKTSGSGVMIRVTNSGSNGSVNIINGYNTDESYDLDEPIIYCYLEE